MAWRIPTRRTDAWGRVAVHASGRSEARPRRRGPALRNARAKELRKHVASDRKPDVSKLACCADAARANASTSALDVLQWQEVSLAVSRHASTAAGARKVASTSPTSSREDARARGMETAHAQRLWRGSSELLRLEEARTDDCASSLRRLRMRQALQASGIAAMATVLATAARTRRAVGAMANRGVRLGALAEPLVGFATRDALVARIYAAIDVADGDHVRDVSRPELRRARERKRIAQEKRRKALLDAAKRGGRPAVVQGRACLAVRDGSSGDGLVLGRSEDGKEVYVEPRSMVRYNEEVAQTERDVVKQERAVCLELSRELLEVVEDVDKALQAVVWLDAVLARVKYGIHVDGSTPSSPGDANQGLRMCLRQLRNPLLVGGLSAGGSLKKPKAKEDADEERQGPVPIDVTIWNGVRGVLITGPNTGGKTAALKSIGLAILMAKAGIPIPAQEPLLVPWFDHVFADIGDEQSLDSSLSTFSGHVSRIQSIANACTSDSLVLLDELGTGTDPKDGAALGAAIMHSFASDGPGGASLTIANTHHSELKALKYSDSRFENVCVEFDEEKLAPTFQLLWGIPGRSNAIHIAERLGLDEDILAGAKELLGTHRVEINELIVQLEEARLRTSASTAEAHALMKEADKLRENLQEVKHAVEKHKAEAYVAAARNVLAEIAVAKGQIQSQRKKRGTAPPRSKQMASPESTPTTSFAKADPSFVPTVGDMVFVHQLGNKAVKVVSMSEKKQKATVDVGALKMTVKLGDITGPAKASQGATGTRRGQDRMMTGGKVRLRGSQKF